MHISVIEWGALKLALRLPRSFLSTELASRTLRRHAATRRGIVTISFVLVTLLVFLHAMTGDSNVRRNTDLIAQLAAVKLIDARWDVAVVQARTDAAATTPVVQAAQLARIQRTLDAAATEARTAALRSSIAELKKAYVEKADVVARFEKASADSRQALAAAMRADAAVTSLVRGVWRDFPQRERLVAAESLVARVLAEAQQYHHSPTRGHRAALESFTADLPRAQSLPRPVQAGLARLESDVHQLLLLKPLEQMLGERLGVLSTGSRVDEVTEIFQRDLADALARRDGYRVVLIVYAVALIALLAYVGTRAYAHYRDLKILYARQTADLARALRKLRDLDRPSYPTEAQRRAAVTSEDTVHIISEYRR